MTNPTHSYTTTIKISAPPDRVWPIMVDIEKWPLWTSTVKRVRRVDDLPFRVGSRVWIHQPKLPPALWRVVSMEECKGFTSISRSPGVTVTARHAIEPDPEGSLVTLSIEFSGFLAPLLARLTGNLTEQYIGIEAAGLKKKSEEAYVSVR